MSDWFEMTDKERNEWLASLGGCGNCFYWSRIKNHLGLDSGCKIPQYLKAAQLYDNGCMSIKPMTYKKEKE